MGHDAASIFSIGLNHHTAPLEIRERIALDDTAVRHHLASLMSDGLCNEALLVSTCNRVELFGVHADDNTDSVFDYFCRMRGATGVAPHLLRRTGREAVYIFFELRPLLIRWWWESPRF